jgi:hypothetical protein
MIFEAFRFVINRKFSYSVEKYISMSSNLVIYNFLNGWHEFAKFLLEEEY